MPTFSTPSGSTILYGPRRLHWNGGPAFMMTPLAAGLQLHGASRRSKSFETTMQVLHPRHRHHLQSAQGRYHQVPMRAKLSS